MTHPSKACRDELIHRLRHTPQDAHIATLIHQLELDQPADLNREGDYLAGIWELRWSSSEQPWLQQSAFLENLQVLDPSQQRGCNILRLRGPLQNAGSIRVEASLNRVDHQRIQIEFTRGGWMPPPLFGLNRMALMRSVKQTFPAWLDITVLDETLRVCRGNAGTTFALLRTKQNLPVNDFFNTRRDTNQSSVT